MFLLLLFFLIELNRVLCEIIAQAGIVSHIVLSRLYRSDDFPNITFVMSCSLP